MSSLLGNFLTNIGGQMRDKENKANEDAQWEKRQRLMADLEVERDSKLAKNKRKDGNTYKDASGQWVTEILDGNGNVTGTRSATQSEVASAENTGYVAEGNKYQTARNKKQLDTFDEEHKLDMEGKRVQIASAQNSIANSNARLALDRQAAGGGTKEDKKDVEDIRQDWNYIVGDLEELEASGVKEAADLRMTWNEFLNSNEYKSMPMWKRKAKLAEYKGKLAGLKTRAKDGSTSGGVPAPITVPTR